MNSNLPKKPGYYLWRENDIEGISVGLARVCYEDADTVTHLRDRIREYGPGKVEFFLYDDGKGRTLTLYHQDFDHMPKRQEDGMPMVDGFKEVNIEWFMDTDSDYKEPCKEESTFGCWVIFLVLVFVSIFTALYKWSPLS